MKHLKLGEILINEGFMTQEQLEKAFEVQKKENARLGETLIKLGLISDEDMTSALGTQLGIPYYASSEPELLTPKNDQDLDKLIPGDFAQKNTVIPISKNLTSLTCAVNDPLDLMMIDNLKHITNCEINIVIATKAAIQKAINNFYFKGASGSGKASLLNQAVEKSFDKDTKDDDLTAASSAVDNSSADLSIDRLMQKASEAPVIKLVDLIIRQAIDERASDIHIEPFDNNIHLRYRIDGGLVDIPPPASHLHLAIVSRIKILAKLDIAEKRLPQDGAISAKLENRKVDIRISTVPTVWGEKIVMRILDKDAVPLELTSLGFDPKQVALLKKALATPYGLFYITGPTGSGKSTSLYAAVNETVDPSKNVMTAEDPVEYKLEGVNQVHVKTEIGLTFAVALKAFLRQDPDIIMVGETRDLDTASICVRAALTGHFVLSTLHTNDAPSAITRLVDIGVPHYLLTPSLTLIMAQRLAKRLCSKCKEPYEPDAAQHGGYEFKNDLIFKAKGCDDCNQLGYKGRVVIAEVMEIDNDIRKIMSEGGSHQELKDSARKNGMMTIFESGLKNVDNGVTSYEEICRISVDA